MDRREFLKAAGAAGIFLVASAARGEEPEQPTAPTKFLAAPCGLYCGVCGEYVKGECHGCGCDCGHCASKWHWAHCKLLRCMKERGLESCAQCADLPCTELIQFAYDPVWEVQEPCLGNCRRRRQIGREAWLQEQQAYWQDPAKREAWLRLDEECRRKWREISAAS